jgi:hypothetical protein
MDGGWPLFELGRPKLMRMTVTTGRKGENKSSTTSNKQDTDKSFVPTDQYIRTNYCTTLIFTEKNRLKQLLT